MQAKLTGPIMKKFSTAVLILAFAAAFGSPAASAAEAARPSRCAFLLNAPDKHVVVRGDTLWDISGQFLQHPWCWPQVWGMNREEIRNPHWIYPGQIVYFDRAAGRLRLGNAIEGASGGAGGVPTIHLSPQVRTDALPQEAIPAIPPNVIEPFLSQPLVIEDHELNDTPRIIATQENRVVLGKGDRAYVRGDLKGNTLFQVFRPATPLKDPVTHEVIGYEAAYLGTVRLERAATESDEADVFKVVSVKQEMGEGDRLLPMPPAPILNYVPHPPEQPVDARIVSIYGGVSQAGQNQIVSINRGRADGIDVGTVLELDRFGRFVTDSTDGDSSWFSHKKPVKLPDLRYGELFIFRVFNHISYGLVMQVTNPVNVGDVAKSPE